MMQLTTGFFFCLVRLEHGLAKGLTDHGLRLLDITTPGGGWQPGPLSFLSQPFRLPSDHPYFPPTGTGTLQMPAPLQTTYQYHCGTVPYYCNRCQRPSRRHGITLAYAPPYSTMQLSSLKARNGRAKEESWQIRSTHGACTSASPCRLVRVVKRKIRFHFSVMRRRGRGLIRAQVCRGGGGGTVCVMADDQILSLLAAVAAAALLLPGLMMRGLFQMACCEE